MNWINSVNPITSNDLYLFPERSLIIYSLHNATELMTWTHPAGCITQLCDFKVCTEYSGGMTGVAWRGIHRIMKMNTDNRFGFNNWRNPKGEEINAMFAGCLQAVTVPAHLPNHRGSLPWVSSVISTHFTSHHSAGKLLIVNLIGYVNGALRNIGMIIMDLGTTRQPTGNGPGWHGSRRTT